MQCRTHEDYKPTEKPTVNCLVCNISFLVAHPALDPATEFSTEQLTEIKSDISVIKFATDSAVRKINKELTMRRPSKDLKPKSPMVYVSEPTDDYMDDEHPEDIDLL